MRIVIDMQGAQTASRLRGIGRYALSLAKALARNRGDHEIILSLNAHFPDTIQYIRREFNHLIPQNQIRVWESPGPVCEFNSDNTWRRNAAELIREAFIEHLNPDFVLLTSLFEGYHDNFAASINRLDKSTPIAVIFYDLIPFIYPRIYLADPYFAEFYYKKLSQLKTANLLLTISEASRNEAIQLLNFPESRVINISAATDQTFFPLGTNNYQRDATIKFGLTKEFLMYTSATDWRKNHFRLIEAYSKLSPRTRASHQLAFVGVIKQDHKLSFMRHAKKLGLCKGELVVIGHVPDNEMNILYNHCKAFILPSWHEGFGLPALEAMKCGRAVIGSNRSSIPEVLGRSDALFDPFDCQSICHAIDKVLNNNSFRAELENHALQQEKKFSWDISALKAITAMENFVKSAGRLFKHTISCTQPNELIKILVEEISMVDSEHTESDLRHAACAIDNNFTKSIHIDGSILPS